MNFEAVLHYKHQNQGRDEKKKLRHASGASATSEASNSDSEVDSTDHSPVPSPGQKKVNEVSHRELNPLHTFPHQSFSHSNMHIQLRKPHFKDMTAPASFKTDRSTDIIMAILLPLFVESFAGKL